MEKLKYIIIARFKPYSFSASRLARSLHWCDHFQLSEKQTSICHRCWCWCWCSPLIFRINRNDLNRTERSRYRALGAFSSLCFFWSGFHGFSTHLVVVVKFGQIVVQLHSRSDPFPLRLFSPASFSSPLNLVRLVETRSHARCKIYSGFFFGICFY